MNSCQMRAAVWRGGVLADHGLRGRGQREERRARTIMAATIQPSEPSVKAAGERNQQKDGDGAKGQRATLVKAAGAAAIGFAAQRAHHAAAGGDDEDAKAGAQEHQPDGPAVRPDEAGERQPAMASGGSQRRRA